jgi:hypothetical protein
LSEGDRIKDLFTGRTLDGSIEAARSLPLDYFFDELRAGEKPGKEEDWDELRYEMEKRGFLLVRTDRDVSNRITGMYFQSRYALGVRDASLYWSTGLRTWVGYDSTGGHFESDSWFDAKRRLLERVSVD